MSAARSAVALAVVAMALANACSASEDTQARLAEYRDVRAEMQARLEALVASGVPGATASVARHDGEGLLQVNLAAGLADRESGERMTPNARMLTGSVGKTFVAAVALQLAHEGRLGLDDPVSRHLGDEPWLARLPNAGGLTVRRLLNHTSGLVRYEFDPDFLAALAKDPLRAWTPEDELAFLLDQQAPFAAGEGWEYSDSNYVLLGLVLERAGGEPLDEQIARRLLRPLFLDDTSPSDGIELPGLVPGYAGAGNGFLATDAVLDERGRMRLNPQFEGAGGGYVTTAQDLARWALELFRDDGGVVPGALRDEHLAGVPAPQLGPGVHYGLGVILRDGPLGEMRGHSGFFPGWQSEVRYYPELRCAVAVQCNSSARPAPLGACADALAELARGLPDRL